MPVESPRPGYAMTSAPCLIETMRREQGKITLLPAHLQRLAASSKALGYAWNMYTVQAQIEQHCADLNPRQTFRVRLLLAPDGGCQITSAPLAPTPEPVRIVLAPEPLVADSLWLVHKTTHRPWYAPVQAWLTQHPDIFDVIVSNPQGEVCEGSRSNIYAQNDEGLWLTPPLACGLLPGVQRQALLDSGQAHETRLTPAELRAARALRVSNALRGWLDAHLSD